MSSLAPPRPGSAVESTRSARRTRSMTPFTMLGAAVAVLLAVLAVYPISRVVAGLFVMDGHLTAAPIRQALALDDLGVLVRNTLVVVIASGALALLIGSLLAWLNERTDARMGTMTDAIPLVPFLLPQIAGAIGWVLLLSPKAGLLNASVRWAFEAVGISMADGPLNIYSWYGLIFVYVLYQIPYVYLMVSAGLRNIDSSLDEQSRVCGIGIVGTLRRVTLPAVRPSLGAAVLLMAWQGFALFSVPVIIGTGANIDVLSVRIVRLLSFTYPPETSTAIGLSFIILAFSGITWYLQARLLRSGRHATLGGKGQRASRIELGKMRLPARLFIVGYGLAAVVLPAVGLALVSLNGFWSADIDWSGLSLKSLMESVFYDSQTMDALRNSVTLGLVGASVGIVAAALASHYLLRSRARAAKLLDGAIKLPAVFSHLVIAVGFILAFAGPPFNLGGTIVILLIAYLSIYMPQGSVAADSASSQVGSELSEASWISGASGGRTFRKINAPLMLPGLVAGWAFLFANMVGDLTASAVLAGTRNTVVGFRILQIFENGTYAELASLSIVLTTVTVVVVVASLLLARRRAKWQRPPRTAHRSKSTTEGKELT